MGDVLVAVKNNKLFQTLADACRDRGFAAVRAQSLDEAEGRLPENSFSALIVNLDDLPTNSEKKIAARLRSLPQGLKLLGLGAGAGLKTVTGYFRAGLTDFLSLPPDPLELAQALTHVLGSLAGPPAGPDGPAAAPVQPPAEAAPAPFTAAAAPAGPSAAPAAVSPARAIVGSSPALMKLFRIIGKVAATDSTVMVHGETGTGKELIARAIHLASPRRDKPMIPVNCGAIPEELLETELFGHEKGAFTNAVKERAGRFELAQGGTVFLDEIGDMSPKLQVKLLRVLQEHEFEKVGGERTIRADIRVITATHVDLAKAVREGRFREDLYFRLNVIPVSVPPLRERAADIPLLVEYFLKKLRDSRASHVTGVSPEAMAQLCAYRWPGNIRELENLMERMVILADGEVLTVEDLPDWVRPVPEVRDEARDALLRGFLEPDEASDLPLACGPADGAAFPPEAQAGGRGGGLPEGVPAAETLDPACGDAGKGYPGAFPGARLPRQEAAGPPPAGYAASPSATGDRSGGQALPEVPAAFPEVSPAPSGDPAASPPESAEEPESAAFSGTDDASPQAGGPSPDFSRQTPLPEGLMRLISPLLEFPSAGVSLASMVKDYEGRLIEAALKASGGFKNTAARLLGINRTTLQEKIRKK
ncbi:MAG: sigma 54-interacting transcriptional regulator [Deltaproteobacteria bacterium]|jgi:DNA-binding NtrC family response regulator|nr:sigma 54-interacting transcriptional regulator [Deltaproteobacteria bacterium]